MKKGSNPGHEKFRGTGASGEALGRWGKDWGPSKKKIRRVPEKAGLRKGKEKKERGRHLGGELITLVKPLEKGKEEEKNPGEVLTVRKKSPEGGCP